MELCEKLQELRKRKGLTQEELAGILYVSRTAVSKWESGRGVPNIESLKAISKYFSVSIDELLSGEEILAVADEDFKQRESRLFDIVFGLLDLSMILFLFLPFFGERNGEIIKEVSLLSLSGTSGYIKAAYFAVISALFLIGILILALQSCEADFWIKYKRWFSFGFGALGAICFIMTLQPYAAFLTFVFLAVKSVMLIKRR